MFNGCGRVGVALKCLEGLDILWQPVSGLSAGVNQGFLRATSNLPFERFCQLPTSCSVRSSCALLLLLHPLVTLWSLHTLPPPLCSIPTCCTSPPTLSVPSLVPDYHLAGSSWVAGRASLCSDLPPCSTLSPSPVQPLGQVTLSRSPAHCWICGYQRGPLETEKREEF